MGLFGFGKVTPERAAPASAASSATASATGPSAPVRGNVVECFADVPEFQRLLSHGEGALCALPQSVDQRLVALDTGALRATIYIDSGLDPGQDAELLQWLKALRAQLRISGFVIEQEREALPSVIRDIRRNPGQRMHNSGAGGPLELFQRWVEIAEGSGATDLHVEIRGNGALVRVRVDGTLEPLDDGSGGRYARSDAHDAIAAGFNSTRKGNSSPHYEAEAFLDCMIGFNTARASGHLRFQNLPGRLGPKAVIRLLRSERVGRAGE
jgi:hypothetical protein